MFDAGVVEEVRKKVEGLLKGRGYEEAWRATEEMVFGKSKSWPGMREVAVREIEAGRGNPWMHGRTQG